MTKSSNIAAFLEKGATVFFAKGTDNSNVSSSKIGKLAMALSLVGSVGLMTPSAAEARGGGGFAAGAIMGLVGGMVLSRTVVAAPVQSYGYQQQYVPVQQYAPVQPYVPAPSYAPPYGAYGSGGYGAQNRPGVYYCPNGPQNRCYWRQGALETIDDGLNKAAELETSAPKMG